MIQFFSKLTRRDTLTRKIENSDKGIYLYILFPISVMFLISFGGSRIISHFWPNFHLGLVEDLHIHHYTYGILALVLAGYFSLVNDRPQVKYLVSLLYGAGLGLICDEFAIWLRLTDESSARWSYDGLFVFLGLFFLLISAEAGVRMWQIHFSKKKVPDTPILGPNLTQNPPLSDPPPGA